MVGSSIHRHLLNQQYKNVITVDKEELDLRDQQSVLDFFESTKIDVVIIAAAKVGGIYFNDNYPADFIFDNLMIEINLINSSHLTNVNRLLFLGSSCIYPRESKQPIREDYLLNGNLELTNESYSIAKIAGIKMCESYNRQYHRDYRSLMPTNLYGPNDNFHPKRSHVLPALLRKIHEAKDKDSNIVIWGTGKPMREFLHVDDLASASLFILNIDKTEYNNFVSDRCSHVNVGSGCEVSIKELAILIGNIIGYNGKIMYDASKPDGTMRKILDTNLINSMGWRSKINLKSGIELTYSWFLENLKSIR